MHAKFSKSSYNACQKRYKKKYRVWCCNACQLTYQLLKRMPTLLFCHCQIWSLATHAKIGIWSLNACQKMSKSKFGLGTLAKWWILIQFLKWILIVIHKALTLLFLPVSYHYTRPRSARTHLAALAGAKNVALDADLPCVFIFHKCYVHDIRKHENMSFHRLSQLLSYIPNKVDRWGK